MSVKKSSRVESVQWVFSIVSWLTVGSHADKESRINVERFIKTQCLLWVIYTF